MNVRSLPALTLFPFACVFACADDPSSAGPTPDAGLGGMADAAVDGGADLPPLSWAPHVRGTFNDWQATDRMSYVGGRVYQRSLVISPDTHEFKIADEDWTGSTIFSIGATSQETLALDTPTVLVGAEGFGNNTVLPTVEEGEYTFTLEVSDADVLTLTVTQGGGGPVELPDDSRPETFDAPGYAFVPLVGGSDRISGPVEFFETLAIEVPGGESAQYILGDNIDGYYEGWTHAYTTASRYRLRTGFLFSYFATLLNGALNDAASAAIKTRVSAPFLGFSDGVFEFLLQGLRSIDVIVHQNRTSV